MRIDTDTDRQWRNQVGVASCFVTHEVDVKIEQLIEDNRASGRTIEAQVAVENTLKMMGHIVNDLHSYHFKGMV